MTIHRHGNAMTMNRVWDVGLRPWREYNGEAFGRDFRNYLTSCQLSNEFGQ